MKFLVISVILLKLVISTRGQVPFAGGCPSVKAVQNFDVKKYLGLWYEQKRYFAVFEAGGICVTAQYTDKGRGVVGVNNTEYNTISRSFNSILGEATLTSTTGEGKLGVKFPSVGGFQAPYTVVGTDYRSYAVVWSCADLFYVGNLQFAWILTRERNPSEETLGKIQQVLANSHLAKRPFRKTRQDCY